MNEDGLEYGILEDVFYNLRSEGLNFYLTAFLFAGLILSFVFNDFAEVYPPFLIISSFFIVLTSLTMGGVQQI